MAPMPALDGQSLQPLLSPGANQDRVLFGETDYPLHFGWAPLRCVRADNTKLIEAPRPEFYDLHPDAGELHNLYEPWNGTIQRLRTLMAERRSKAENAKRKDTGPVDPRTVAELRALGYLGPEGSTRVPEPSLLPDPKDKIEVQNLLHQAMQETERVQKGRA